MLDSLKDITLPLDIIVVDGNSDDNTCKVVKDYQRYFNGNSSLRLISLEERGISYQRNIGAENARYDTLIFCDADCIIPSPESYKVMLTEFASNGDVVAAPYMKPIERRWDIRVFHFCIRLMIKFFVFIGRPHFGGAGLMTKCQIFEEIGGFNEEKVHGENINYTLKASKKGSYHILNAPILISARRFTTYGYSWALKNILSNTYRKC